MKKRKTKAEKMQEAMVERAVNKAAVGFQIPIMSMTAIYKYAEHEGAKPGATEKTLEADVRSYIKSVPGVIATAAAMIGNETV